MKFEQMIRETERELLQPPQEETLFTEAILTTMVSANATEYSTTASLAKVAVAIMKVINNKMDSAALHVNQSMSSMMRLLAHENEEAAVVGVNSTGAPPTMSTNATAAEQGRMDAILSSLRSEKQQLLVLLVVVISVMVLFSTLFAIRSKGVLYPRAYIVNSV